MTTIRERIADAKQHALLTVDEVALIARYAPLTIYRKVAAKQIPGVVRVGRGIRFQRDVILEWADAARESRSL